MKVWNAQSGKVLQTLKGHNRAVFSAAFSADSKRIVSGSIDNTVKVWNAQSGKILQTLQGHTGAVNSVAFSPDSERIVSGSDDGTVKVWDRAIKDNPLRKKKK